MIWIGVGRNAVSPWEELKRQAYLGDEAFVDAMLAKLEADAPLDDITTTHHRPPPKPLEHYGINGVRVIDFGVTQA